jgi:hypothetical protein
MSIILGILIVLASFSAFGQARPGSYPWKIIFNVIDDIGRPIADAQVLVGYLQTNQITGLTDTNGTFSVSHDDRSWALGFLVNKSGYYSDYVHYELFKPGQFDDSKVAANRNSTQVMILRKIGNPIPLYAEQAHIKLKDEDKPIGFDLMAGDLATPYGRGFHTDMFFTVHRKIINEHKYNCVLDITFPNKGDGIVVAQPEVITGSEFKTSRVAIKNGYESELNLHYSDTNQPEPVFGYFIRTRTELDQNGNVKSALYGKINGNFRFYAGTIVPHSGMGFTYYLNPTPNDTNLEFDTKNNLIRDLKPLEEVKEP